MIDQAEVQIEMFSIVFVTALNAGGIPYLIFQEVY